MPFFLSVLAELCDGTQQTPQAPNWTPPSLPPRCFSLLFGLMASGVGTKKVGTAVLNGMGGKETLVGGGLEFRIFGEVML